MIGRLLRGLLDRASWPSLRCKSCGYLYPLHAKTCDPFFEERR